MIDLKNKFKSVVIRVTAATNPMDNGYNFFYNHRVIRSQEIQQQKLKWKGL